MGVCLRSALSHAAAAVTSVLAPHQQEEKDIRLEEGQKVKEPLNLWCTKIVDVFVAYHIFFTYVAL